MLLKNDFHHSEVQINLRGRYYLSDYQTRRAWKKLCGVKDCQCHCGIAGEQPLRQWLNGSLVIVLPREDGTASLVPPPVEETEG